MTTTRSRCPARPTAGTARASRFAAALGLTGAIVAGLGAACAAANAQPLPGSQGLATAPEPGPSAGWRPADPPPPGAGIESEAACAAPLPVPRLSFAQAQARLARCNRALRGAVGAIAAPQADLTTAAQRPNPTLSGGLGDVNPQRGIGSGNPLDRQVDYVMRLDQTLERGDKRALRREAAGHALAAARLAAAEVLRQQSLALAQAWIDLWGGQQRVALQAELTGLVRRTLDGAQRRLEAGDVAAADVARIALDVQRADAERLAAEGELARARAVLAPLLALEPQAAALEATEPWPALGTVPGEVLAGAEARRPDLEAARAQQRQAEVQRRLAQAQGTRDVGVGVQLERYAPPAGGGWLLGAFVSLPLFVHHRFEGEIARAEADREIAAETRSRLERGAGGEQQRLAAALAASRARRERLEREALPLAARVAANAELAYRKGAGTVLELLDALRQQRAVQLEALDASLESDRAEAALRALLMTTAAAADPVFGEALRWTPDMARPR